MEEEEAASSGDVEENEMKEEEVFEMEQAPLCYSRAPGHYRQNQRTKRIMHTRVVE